MSQHANCRPQDRAGSPASALGLAFAANQSLPTPAEVESAARCPAFARSPDRSTGGSRHCQSQILGSESNVFVGARCVSAWLKFVSILITGGTPSLFKSPQSYALFFCDECVQLPKQFAIHNFGLQLRVRKFRCLLSQQSQSFAIRGQFMDLIDP
jgi:hypothetical protein